MQIAQGHIDRFTPHKDLNGPQINARHLSAVMGDRLTPAGLSGHHP
jgi:hypothetical protein